MMRSLDAEEFRRQGHMVVDLIADYYKNIEDHPVISSVEPGYLSKCLPKSAPYSPELIEAILHDVKKHIIPGLTHWQSPNFFAYYQSNASIAGVLGEMLCSGFAVVGFSWVSSPAATELESLVMDWLGDMLKLPTTFLFSGGRGGGGIILGNTTEAIICTLVAARDKALQVMKDDGDAILNGGKCNTISISKLVVYGSDQTHCSFRKAAQIVGISPQNIREIKTTDKAGFAMCPKDLRKAILKDIETGLVPLYLCATIGTTSTSAMDPLPELCQVANEHGMWVHVDAAYAGAACICPEFRQLIDGVELADSFSFNAHKWLLTGLDCCCLWVKDPTSLAEALSTDAEYLRNKASESKLVVDYKDWQISLSRRFRALKLWLVLRSHGVVNLRRHIRNHVRLAKISEELVTKDRRFELVGQRSLALVCFRVSPLAVTRSIIGLKCKRTTIGVGLLVNAVNAKVMERVNESGRVFMTHTVVGGVYVMRFAVGSTLVEERHVLMAWKLVQEQADLVLSLSQHKLFAV